MMLVYAIKGLGERLARQLLEALRILSGMKPSTVPESREIEDEPPSNTDTDEPDSPSTANRRLSSNQRGRYGRH